MSNFRTPRFRDEPLSMMSKKKVGSRDHRYLQKDLIIQVVPFNQMMDQQNALLSLVECQNQKRLKFYV